MLELLMNRKGPGKIGALQLDATLSENHDYSNNVTDNPVERGFNMNDHVIRSPEGVTIEGLITNSPVKYLAGTEDRIGSAFETLLAIAGFDPVGKNSSVINGVGRKPLKIDVVTSLRTYTDMITRRLSIPREADSTGSLRFTMEFRRLVIVNTELVSIDNTSELNGKAPNAGKQAAKKQEKGPQTGKTADAAGKEVSFLKRFANSALSLAGN